jgi:hypothetical protein
MPNLASNSGLHWPGASLILLISAVLIASGSLWRSKLMEPRGWVDHAGSDSRRGLRRFAAGPLLSTFSIAGAIAILGLGTTWRHRTAASPQVETAEETVAVETETQPAPQLAETSATSPTEAPLEPSPPASALPAPELEEAAAVLAPEGELRKGLSLGLDALLPLLERYPNDPKVLRAVAFGQASRAASLGDALNTLQKLFEVAPQSVNDTVLQRMVIQMTKSKSARGQAFLLMGTRMGHAGTDLLYRMSRTAPKQREDALSMLARPKVRKNFSPALAIAYDLRFAESCAARLPLLARAEQFGDDRSIRVLRPLAVASKNNCGTAKPCKPTCAAEAERILVTLDKIGKRLENAESARAPAQ